jgi:hypothetical protein
MAPSKSAASRKREGTGKRPSRRGKVRKEFWLDPKALRRAQTLLGAETERETVELALDLVAFRQELSEGLETLAGLELDRRD